MIGILALIVVVVVFYRAGSRNLESGIVWALKGAIAFILPALGYAAVYRLLLLPTIFDSIQDIDSDGMQMLVIVATLFPGTILGCIVARVCLLGNIKRVYECRSCYFVNPSGSKVCQRCGKQVGPPHQPATFSSETMSCEAREALKKYQTEK